MCSEKAVFVHNILKILGIDSAKFRNIKDYSIIKGEIIGMRTCIDTCYNRYVDRYIDKVREFNLKYNEDDLENYKNKKVRMYSWDKI